MTFDDSDLFEKIMNIIEIQEEFGVLDFDGNENTLKWASPEMDDVHIENTISLLRSLFVLNGFTPTDIQH